MELVGITALRGDCLDRQIGEPHQFRRVCQALANQKLLGSTAHLLLEFPAEIVAVQLAEAGNLIDCQFPVIVLPDVDDSLIDIKIPLYLFSDIPPLVVWEYSIPRPLMI